VIAGWNATQIWGRVVVHNETTAVFTAMPGATRQFATYALQRFGKAYAAPASAFQLPQFFNDASYLCVPDTSRLVNGVWSMPLDITALSCSPLTAPNNRVSKTVAFESSTCRASPDVGAYAMISCFHYDTKRQYAENFYIPAGSMYSLTYNFTAPVANSNYSVMGNIAAVVSLRNAAKAFDVPFLIATTSDGTNVTSEDNLFVAVVEPVKSSNTLFGTEFALTATRDTTALASISSTMPSSTHSSSARDMRS